MTKKHVVDRASVQGWLDRYVDAWKSYDPEAIGDLFAKDARYFPGPFDEPYEGREAIVAAWLENPDKPGTYDARYEPMVIEGDTAVTCGRTTYFEENSTGISSVWSNVFILKFDRYGRCLEYREWYMQGPSGG